MPPIPAIPGACIAGYWRDGYPPDAPPAPELPITASRLYFSGGLRISATEKEEVSAPYTPPTTPALETTPDRPMLAESLGTLNDIAKEVASKFRAAIFRRHTAAVTRRLRVRVSHSATTMSSRRAARRYRAPDNVGAAVFVFLISSGNYDDEKFQSSRHVAYSCRSDYCG